MPQGETTLQKLEKNFTNLLSGAKQANERRSSVRELKRRRKKVHNIDYRKNCTIDNKTAGVSDSNVKTDFLLNEIILKPFKLSDRKTDLFKVNWLCFSRRVFRQTKAVCVENVVESTIWQPLLEPLLENVLESAPSKYIFTRYFHLSTIELELCFAFSLRHIFFYSALSTIMYFNYLACHTI